MYYVEMSKIDTAAPRLLLKSEWMVETNKECNSHPFTSPLKKDGIPQFPSKFCGMVDGYRPFKDGYPSPFLVKGESGDYEKGPLRETNIRQHATERGGPNADCES